MRDNEYGVLIAKHQKEWNEFPIRFAFSDKQFEEGMRELGLDPTDTDEVYGLFGTGGFYRRSDSGRLLEMIKRHGAEMEEAIAADKTGEGFIKDMFEYELNNHEYGYTRDISDTLDALELTVDEIESDERFAHGLALAIKEVVEWYDANN